MPQLRAAVIGSEPVHAGRPDAIRIARIDRDDVVVPPIVGERVLSPRDCNRAPRRWRVGQQHRVEQGRVAVGDARLPRAGIAAAIAAIHREQALLIVAVRARRRCWPRARKSRRGSTARSPARCGPCLLPATPSRRRIDRRRAGSDRPWPVRTSRTTQTARLRLDRAAARDRGSRRER